MTLEKLDDSRVTGVPKKLGPKETVEDARRPYNNDTGLNGPDKLNDPPPSFDSGPINNQNTLSYRKCAVIPDQEKVKDGINGSVMKDQV